MRGDLSILLFTLEVALAATLLILPLGVAAAWGLARWRGPGRSTCVTLLSLPLVLPPTAIGLFLLQLLSRDSFLGNRLAAAGIEILFTWKGVLLATAVMSFPLLVRSALTAFEEVDPRLLAVARTLGHPPASVFLRVTLPLAWRGVLAGAILAFCRALGEFGATIMVAGNIPGRTQTAALAIFHRAEMGNDGDAMRLAGFIVAVAFIAIWVVEGLGRRRSLRQQT